MHRSEPCASEDLADAVAKQSTRVGYDRRNHHFHWGRTPYAGRDIQLAPPSSIVSPSFLPHSPFFFSFSFFFFFFSHLIGVTKRQIVCFCLPPDVAPFVLLRESPASR